jgi:hypothetical protein
MKKPLLMIGRGYGNCMRLLLIFPRPVCHGAGLSTCRPAASAEPVATASSGLIPQPFLISKGLCLTQCIAKPASSQDGFLDEFTHTMRPAWHQACTSIASKRPVLSRSANYS